MRLRRRMQKDIESDIREHIEMLTRDNIERGMSPAEARNAAMRKFGSPLRELRMERYPPDPKAKALPEFSLDRIRALGFSKANSPKRSRLAVTQIDAQRFQCRQGVRHQAFAAGFIYREAVVICHSDTQAALCGQNCRGETRRSAADNKDIRRMRRQVHSCL